MSDAPAPSVPVALRFARLVALAAAEPSAMAAQRGEVRALAKALKKRTAVLSLGPEGAALDGDAPLVADAPDGQAAVTLLAARMAAFGVERLELGAAATDADLFDLVKLLATAPDHADPPSFFAARGAAIDARAIPRTLRRAAEPAEPPSVEEPASVKEPRSVKEPQSAKEPASARPSAAVPTPSGPMAAVDVADPRTERLTESLPIPETTDEELRTLFTAVQEVEHVEHLRDPLDRLVTIADHAFRSGRFDRVVEAMAGLVAIEHSQLERDGSDERRREFARALRRLATPVLLRQVAVLRHRRADDAGAARQLQAILYRYGTDGAEALIDEWANAPTDAVRTRCLEALRGLRRTHDALFDLVRHTDDLRVRDGITLLGALGDARAEQLLLEQLRHPDMRTRREVMAALERFPGAQALEAIGVGLLDDAPVVRLRAVAAIVPRGAAAVQALTALLDAEPDREVLYAAIAGLGTIGTPEAVQALIRAANGETAHPRRKGASYRLQACAALVRIRTPQAMAAVQVLRDDRDREVREGSMRLVAQAARRGTTATRAVSAP